MLGIEPKASHTLNTHFTTELFPQPNICLLNQRSVLGYWENRHLNKNPENTLVEGLQRILKWRGHYYHSLGGTELSCGQVNDKVPLRPLSPQDRFLVPLDPSPLSTYKSILLGEHIQSGTASSLLIPEIPTIFPSDQMQEQPSLC